MTAKEMLLKVYKQFYVQKELLGDQGAVLRIRPEDLMNETEEYGPVFMAVHQSLIQVVSPLLGVSDVTFEDMSQMAERVAKGYSDQEFWRELFFDYLEYLLEKEKEEIINEEKSLILETRETLKDILIQEAQEKKIVNAFAVKIKDAGFRVDGVRLISNYLKMMRQDSDQAWRVLTTNPAMFAPILVKDQNGKQVLTPEAAREENRKLARFLSGLQL